MAYDELLKSAMKLLEGRYLFSHREILIWDLMDAVKELSAKMDKLRTALQPFAEAAEDLTSYDKDEWDISEHHCAQDVYIKDLRAARDTIAELARKS